MTGTADISAIGQAYAHKFDNLDEVSHSSFLFDPRFGKLMQSAIDRNTPLDRAEVEAVFGEPGWEW